MFFFILMTFSKYKQKKQKSYDNLYIIYISLQSQRVEHINCHNFFTITFKDLNFPENFFKYSIIM